MNSSVYFPFNDSLASFTGNRNNMTFPNITTPVVANWTIMPIFSLMTFIFGCLGNGTLLLLFATDRTLWTPFNVYLINLLIANLSCVLVQYPMDIIYNLYSFTWSMSNTACTVYLYGCNMLEAAILNAHQLIALNRIWAVVHPISYRSCHSIRTAVFFCLGMWVYIHLIMEPGLVIDAMYYRLPVETNGCLLNTDAQPTWNKITMIVVLNPPIIVMILAFPVIYSTRIMRRKAAHRQNVVVPNSQTRGLYVSEQIHLNYSETRKHEEDFSETTKSTRHGSLVVSGGNRGTRVSPTSGTQMNNRPVKLLKQNSHGYLVLALLSSSAVICWTPIAVYYNSAIFAQMELPTSYYQVATIMFACQNMIDPILFTVALKRLRDSFRRKLQPTNS